MPHVEQGLVQAQLELAKAEMAKGQSQTEANQANAALKMQELELKAAEAQEFLPALPRGK